MTPEEFFSTICEYAQADDPAHVPDLLECRLTMTESYAADRHHALDARLAEAVKIRLGADGLSRYWPLVRDLVRQVHPDDFPSAPSDTQWIEP